VEERRQQNLLYDNGEKIIFQKETGFTENRFTEMLESPMELISETDQRYQADINTSLYEADTQRDPYAELKVDPGSIDYYLEPGEAAEIRREVPAQLIKNGERYPISVKFESALHTERIDTILHYNVEDPKIEALADDSATVIMENHPVKNTAT
jgi:hypothetical protein